MVDIIFVFSFSIQRSVGTDGIVTVNWRIRPIDGGTDDRSSTFNVISGQILFPTGTSSKAVSLQVCCILLCGNFVL